MSRAYTHTRVWPPTNRQLSGLRAKLAAIAAQQAAGAPQAAEALLAEVEEKEGGQGQGQGLEALGGEGSGAMYEEELQARLGVLEQVSVGDLETEALAVLGRLERAQRTCSGADKQGSAMYSRGLALKAQALLQELAEHRQDWHRERRRLRQQRQFDGLAAQVQALTKQINQTLILDYPTSI